MNFKLLHEICTINSSSYNFDNMVEFIITYCQKQNYNVEIDGWQNIIVSNSKNDLLNGFCCHTDTVHKFNKKTQRIKKISNVWSSVNGIGGDDKVGIFLCLELLKNLPDTKCFFFSQEEIGTVGSSSIDLKYFNDIKFLIEIDRKGNSDFVTNIYNKLSSETFQNQIKNIIKKFNYSFSNGGLTDVATLQDRGLNINVANVSCGYYNPHTKQEFIVLADVENCYSMLLSVANTIKTKEEYKVIIESYFVETVEDYARPVSSQEVLIKCSRCGNDFLVLCEDVYFCPDCLATYKKKREKYKYYDFDF